VYLIIGGVCGAIALGVAGGTAGGFVISLLVGFLGAFPGTWLAHQLHLPLFVVTIGGHPFSIVWSIVGGILHAAVANLSMRPRYVNRYAR
jgi:uncharacterized membrane protein YeaQ/YmgE (transglycosylase-associated protein family)